MEAALEDTLLQDALLPSWAVGCRRLAPDTGYIEASKGDYVMMRMLSLR